MEKLEKETNEKTELIMKTNNEVILYYIYLKKDGC